jgi:hypothetical protein
MIRQIRIDVVGHHGEHDDPGFSASKSDFSPLNPTDIREIFANRD